MVGRPFDANTLKELWDTWNIRVLIMLSLLLQSFLILLAPFRRSIGDKWFFRFPLWLAYLLADWIAIFVIGLILHVERSDDILVFWAPFLLLHLGGPDTITSFSLEDNEFWIRHLLQLILQVGSTVYAIIQSLPHNKLLLPTLLVLIAGIIKYAERNRALYLACSDHYGEARFSFLKKFVNEPNSNEPNSNEPNSNEPNSNEANSNEPNSNESNSNEGNSNEGNSNEANSNEANSNEANSNEPNSNEPNSNEPNSNEANSNEANSNEPNSNEANSNEANSNEPNSNEANSNETLLLLQELIPYGTLRNLLLGPLITPKRRQNCKEFFSKKEPERVLQMIEFELSLLYEILHTKLPVVKCKIGYIFRIICIGCIFGALLSFRLITKAKQYRDELANSEVWITYGLLIGAITLDFISIRLLISSDYFTTDNKGLQAVKNRASVDSIEGFIEGRVSNRSLWSKRIPQLNLSTYFVKACPDWLHKLEKFLPIRFILEFIQGFRSMSSQDFESSVWNRIFTEVEEKAESADTVAMGKEICLRRGDAILVSHINEDLIRSVEGSDEKKILLKRLDDVKTLLKGLDDVKTLLTWHIATELCFIQDPPSPSSEKRRISKLLSDYMFYLLREETVIGSKIDRRMVLDDTYEHIQYFRREKRVIHKKDVFQRISTDAVVEPSNPASKSVLHKAKTLLDELKKSDEDIRWELMSKVWVELMCYAAINCRPNLHAQHPSMGGQLITIVWLLMNHFGLGIQFETDRDAVRPGDQETGGRPADVMNKTNGDTDGDAVRPEDQETGERPADVMNKTNGDADRDAVRPEDQETGGRPADVMNKTNGDTDRDAVRAEDPSDERATQCVVDVMEETSGDSQLDGKV